MIRRGNTQAKGKSLKHDSEPITIVHSIALDEVAAVGGIETWINDLLDFRTLNYRVLGVALRKSSGLKNPRFDGALESFVIARIPRQRRLLPHAARLAIGLVKHRNLLTQRILVHRIELVPILRALRPHAEITVVVHTNLRAQVLAGSDSLWRFLRFIYFAFETVAIKYADRVITHASADAPRLQKKAASLTVMAGWFNDRHFGCVSDDSPRAGIIWVGRFEKVKDPLLAIQALAMLQVASLGPFTFVGSGAMQSYIEREALKRGISDIVRIQSPLTSSELSELMTQHAVLLHTSHFEGSPRVLLEALASGLTVVTLPECDPDRWVEKTGAGCYADSRDPIDVAQAIVWAPRLSPTEIASSIAFRSASKVIPEVERLISGKSM